MAAGWWIWLAAVAAFGTVDLSPRAASAGDPRSVLLPCEWVGDIDRIDFDEPSGIVFHRERGTLFVVGDDGDVGEIGLDGALVQQRHLREENADFEGVTYDPATGWVYVVVEEPPLLLELDPSDLAVRREIRIERSLAGRVILSPAGQGLEGVTFVADVRHPQGGTFYVVNQAFGDVEGEVSGIVELAVPLRTSGAIAATPVAVYELGIIDLAAIHHDTAGGQFIVFSDATNTMSLVSMEGELQRVMALPGRAQEGVTLDDEGHLYIAQDSGGIIKLRWLRAGGGGE